MSGPKVLIHWPIFYFRIKKVIKAFNPAEKGLMVVYQYIKLHPARLDITRG